ncbi:nuclear protein [Podila epigama]|nr:nuclear protein [Podila epigama]
MSQQDDSQHQLDQIKLKKREIRQQYRDIIHDTEVSGTHEATLDSKLLVMSADLGMQKAKHLRMGQGGFDETEYVTRLVGLMGGHDVSKDSYVELDWSKVGRLAAKWTRRVPTMDFMLGPMSVEHTKRNINRRARVVRDPNQMRKPQELKEEDIARQENETTKNVHDVYRVLCDHGDPVTLFELVVNPESFGQTVENIFYLSFLVRDGKVSITEVDLNNPDDDLNVVAPRANANVQPMVEVTEPPTSADYQAGLIKKQMVMEIDMATWREIIEMYNIKKSMIPTRVAKEKLDGKWYG